VDGFSQETYERFRVGGDLKLVKSNLERAAKIRDRLGLETRIVYKFLIFSWNEHEVADAQRYAARLGIDFQPQGDVAPCCITPKASDRFGRVVPGRVGFGEIWNNALYRKSRAAFAGEDVPDLAEADTVWARCHFPDAFKQVFSHNDFKVVGQFFDRFPGTSRSISRSRRLQRALLCSR
jgi:hypothetical protein